MRRVIGPTPLHMAATTLTTNNRLVKRPISSIFMGCQEGSVSGTSPLYLCSVVHEYSARVTNGNKLKYQKQQ